MSRSVDWPSRNISCDTGGSRAVYPRRSELTFVTRKARVRVVRRRRPRFRALRPDVESMRAATRGAASIVLCRLQVDAGPVARRFQVDARIPRRLLRRDGRRRQRSSPRTSRRRSPPPPGVVRPFLSFSARGPAVSTDFDRFSNASCATSGGRGALLGVLCAPASSSSRRASPALIPELRRPSAFARLPTRTIAAAAVSRKRADVAVSNPTLPTKPPISRRRRTPERPPRHRQSAGRLRRRCVPFPGRSERFRENRHEIVVFWPIFKCRNRRVWRSLRVAWDVCNASPHSWRRRCVVVPCWRGSLPGSLRNSTRSLRCPTAAGTRPSCSCRSVKVADVAWWRFLARFPRRHDRKRGSTPKRNENGRFRATFKVRIRGVRRSSCVGEALGVPRRLADTRVAMAAPGGRSDAVHGLHRARRPRRRVSRLLQSRSSRAIVDLARGAGSRRLLRGDAAALGPGVVTVVDGGLVSICGRLYARRRALGGAGIGWTDCGKWGSLPAWATRFGVSRCALHCVFRGVLARRRDGTTRRGATSVVDRASRANRVCYTRRGRRAPARKTCDSDTATCLGFIRSARPVRNGGDAADANLEVMLVSPSHGVQDSRRRAGARPQSVPVPLARGRALRGRARSVGGSAQRTGRGQDEARRACTERSTECRRGQHGGGAQDGQGASVRRTRLTEAGEDALGSTVDAARV